MEMLQTIGKAWKIPELRRKIIFTLLMLVVFRIGSNIPVPGIDRSMLEQMFSGEYGLFDLFDLFSSDDVVHAVLFPVCIPPAAAG